MLGAIKIETTGNVTAKLKVETGRKWTPKVAQLKATELDLRKMQIQRTCLKPRVIKLCRSRLYLFHQVQVAINLTDKMRHALMKVAVTQADPTLTRTARTEAVAEVVNFSWHIKPLKLNTLYKNRLKSYPDFLPTLDLEL